MLKELLTFLIISLLLLTPIQSEETTIEPRLLEHLEEKENVPVIVELKKPKENLSMLEKLTATNIPLKKFSQNWYRTVLNKKDLKKLLTDPNVKTIREDEIFKILLTDTVPLINASIIHTLQNGTTNLTGLGQSLCIIDTGINATHPGLAGRIVAQKCFCAVSNKGSGGCCPDNTTEDNTATDDHGHGTHISGITAGNGSSITGVAPEASIVTIKVTDAAGDALFSDLTSAVNWCTSNASRYNISVISISLGGGSYSNSCDSDYSSLSSEINTAWNNNISVVVASGNSGFTTNMTAPACINKTISVSSTTKVDAISSFSNRNALTDLFAPGSSINSTKYTGGTETRSGTSMAAPHVAGVIALMQQYKETVEGRNLTVNEINTTLATNGTAIDDTSGSGRSFVRLDAKKALAAIDTLFPLFENPNTTTATLFIYSNITFIVNITDITREVVWIEGNWSGARVNYTMGNRVDNQFNYSLHNNSFTTGQVFHWRIHANDSHNNENISSWFTITILTGAPRITLNSPANLTNTKNLSATFNFSALEDVSDAFNCTLYLNSVLNQTKTNIANATLTEFRQNLTEGTHLWNIACTDVHNLIGNSSLQTLILDTTAPTFNAEGYTSLVELGDNQSYSINLTDLYLNYVNFSYLGTNYTLTNISTNFSRVFQTFQNDTNLFTTYARDDANNLNLTSGNFTVNDSISGPRILNTIYYSSVTQNTSQNVSVWVLNALPLSSVLINPNGSNYSMSNNTVYNYTFSFTATSCGTQSFKIFSNDSTNLAVTNTTSYSVTGCCGDGSCSSGESCSSCSTDCGTCSSSGSSSSAGTSSSSAGGGGTSTSPASAPEVVEEAPTIITQIIAEASPESPIELEVGSDNIPVSALEILVNTIVQNIEITVEALTSKPSEIPSPEDKVIYQYLAFTTTNLEQTAISSADIEFYIPNLWFTENNIEKETISLLRYTENTWQTLPTEYLREEESTVYYHATTSGFSYFVIAAEKAQESTPANATSTEQTQGAEEDAKKQASTESWMRYFLYSILLVLLIVAGIILFRHIQKKRKEANI